MKQALGAYALGDASEVSGFYSEKSKRNKSKRNRKPATLDDYVGGMELPQPPNARHLAEMFCQALSRIRDLQKELQLRVGPPPDKQAPWICFLCGGKDVRAESAPVRQAERWWSQGKCVECGGGVRLAVPRNWQGKFPQK